MRRTARLTGALVAAGLLVLPESAWALSDKVVPGKRVGAIRLGMTRSQVNARLDVVSRTSTETFYAYPKVSLFSVVFKHGKADAIITNGRRFSFGGVHLGQRRSRTAPILRRRGLHAYDCRATNGMTGFARRIIRYDLDSHRRKLDLLTVGHDVLPSCE